MGSISGGVTCFLEGRVISFCLVSTCPTHYSPQPASGVALLAWPSLQRSQPVHRGYLTQSGKQAGEGALAPGHMGGSSVFETLLPSG